MSMWRRAWAELFGTLWLVLGGCGTAVLSAAFPALGVGFAGVALAFGLSVLTAAYALGPISGGHFNPAVSVGLWAAGRFPGRDLPAYVLAQLAGAVAGGGILYAIASGAPGFDLHAGFACNGFGAHSPGHYALSAAAIVEIVMTAGFLMVILGVTDPVRGTPALAPVAIGLALTVVHLVSIPVTNASINPARSTGVALYAGGWAARQLWVFWVTPVLGGILGGLTHRSLVTPVRRTRNLPVPSLQRPQSRAT